MTLRTRLFVCVSSHVALRAQTDGSSRAATRGRRAWESSSTSSGGRTTPCSDHVSAHEARLSDRSQGGGGQEEGRGEARTGFTCERNREQRRREERGSEREQARREDEG
eukprot:3552356-Rhodomonas_salina.1